MTAFTGTVVTQGRNGDAGQQFESILIYDLNSVALANTDTITWTNAFPATGDWMVVDMEFIAPELDTNATPTGTFIIGDGTDTDAYLVTKGMGVALSNSLPGQLSYFGDGASINTIIRNNLTNVVLTVNAAVATGATTGVIQLKFTLQTVI